MNDVEGCVLVGHDGMYFGYEAEMMYYPQARLAIAIAYNCNFRGYIHPILFASTSIIVRPMRTI